MPTAVGQVALQDLPAGFQKESVSKIIMLKKKSMQTKGLWATSVDLVYKQFVSTVTLAQSPNRMSPVE